MSMHGICNSVYFGECIFLLGRFFPSEDVLPPQDAQTTDGTWTEFCVTRAAEENGPAGVHSRPLRP